MQLFGKGCHRHRCEPYVCFTTTKIFDIFALWFISFLSSLLVFGSVIVLRSIWSTWVTKDTGCVGCKEGVDYPEWGWMIACPLFKKWPLMLFTTIEAQGKVFCSEAFYSFWLKVESRGDEKMMKASCTIILIVAQQLLVHFTGNQFFSPCSSMEFFLSLSVHLSKSVTFSFLKWFLLWQQSGAKKSWRASNLDCEKFWSRF